MTEITNLEPKRVFYYFNEISKIPHGSGNTKEISDYLVDFAKSHNLTYRQDNLNNVIIWKEGKGKPVIIQGHMDMVCEKEPGCKKDMDKEGLELIIDGDFLTAKGTTLGGDDGIAIAIALAILESDDNTLPPIEAIITVDEETGMLGAADIDLTDVNGRTMLNIDSEDEGIFTVSCAGGVLAYSSVDITREAASSGDTYKLTIDGLAGGHSGVEIHKNRANAIELLGRALRQLQDNVGIQLIDLCGGAKDNAIAISATAVFTISDKSDLLATTIDEIKNNFANEYASTDSGVNVLCQPTACNLLPMTYDCTNQIIRLLTCSPNGVQRMSPDVEGLVQTSLNMGVLKSNREVTPDNSITDDSVMLTFCVRSSIESEKEALMKKLRDITTLVGGTIDFEGNYPGWKYEVESPLRDLMVQVFKEQYNYEPKVEAIHAGVECGYFSAKIPGLDCVSFGPDLKDIHTFRERMDIKSVERVYKMTLEVLRRLADK